MRRPHDRWNLPLEQIQIVADSLALECSGELWVDPTEFARPSSRASPPWPTPWSTTAPVATTPTKVPSFPPEREFVR
jgi:hypothetical protein